MPARANISLRELQDADESAFSARPAAFHRYLQDQANGLRRVRVAEWQGEFAGYVTLLWVAEDPALRDDALPEVSDLQVLPGFRGRGIGSVLMDEIESIAATRCEAVGLTVGLHSGYGRAQRMYVLRGYVPDGSGVLIDGSAVPEGSTIRLDDNPIVTLRLTKALRGAV